MPLALRLLWRDARHGELWLLLAALVLAVAATTSLRFFSASLELGLKREAASLIAADLVLRSTRPLRPEVVQEAQARGLRQTRLTEFPSMVQYGEQFQLASVKAVAPGYPLRGELAIRDATGERRNPGIPAVGQIWLDQRLIGLLQAGLGDEIQLGDTRLRISAILTEEPDRGGNFSAFSPRALMNEADMAAANLIQPGSRVSYRLLLAGPPAALAAFKASPAAKPQTGERLVDVAGGRPEVGTPLQKAADYLSLAAIAAVVLAGVAVALSARRFSERHFDALALFRCLGASRRRVQSLYWQQLGLIWLLALIGGGALGLLASRLLFALLQGLLPVSELEFAWARPLLTGLATATLTLLGFALPAFISLFRVSPLRVLRRELAPASLSTVSITLLALAALFLLLTLETGRWQLTAIVVLGGSLLTGLLALGLWWLLHKSRPRVMRSAQRRPWQLGLRELWRSPAATITQLLGFALGITAMLLVTSLRGELLAAWQSKLPEKAPNQFALGIPSEEMPAFQAALQAEGLRHAGLYPVVRGRLTAINGQPVRRAVSKEDGEQEESLNRELNLTFAESLPAGNTLLAGAWWPQAVQAPWPVSLESKLAERLQLKLGDTLRFTLAEGEVEARVSSLREVDWDSFQPNFYMVFPPQALREFPASYLTSFHVEAAQRPALNRLVQAFPTVVLIDVAAVMQQVRGLLDQVSLAVEFVLVFVLAAGVLVLLACVAATLDGRRREASLLRALGASRAQLRTRLGIEMLALGFIAGLIAVVLTEIIAATLYLRVLELPPTLHPELWLITPLAGAALTGMAGLLGARRVWTASPLTVLRES